MPHAAFARRFRALSGMAGVLLLLAVPRVATPAEPVAVERWYEILERGGKLGHQRVVWAPSTWEGRKTVHDTTTVRETSVRDMLGMKDTFEVSTTIDLERSDDGTLWWQRVVVQEAARTRTSELRWTGKGYVHVERIGDEEERRVEIPLDAPVMTDSESALGPRARAGTLRPGEVLPLRVLDVSARGTLTSELHVVGPDRVEGEDGPVDCVKVEEREPKSGSTSWIWLDADGAFVQARSEGGRTYRRTTRARAEEAPAQPAEHTITTPAFPPLERIFSADRVTIDLHLQGDADRPLPRFPDSPWSRTLETRGDDATGWTIRMELRAYDDAAPHARAPFPVTDAAFAADLEPTVLMQAKHPRLVEAAKKAIGDATDARTAAHRLARYVHDTLDKQSPEVAQASALQILEECRGDCSEHALLFVALCRAAGIPSRLCSGYVCVGSDWGAHSWAEIWTGRWIGADPTTGEVGTGARYLFFGYPDRPDSFPGVVSARARGRMRIVTTRVEEGDDAYDLTDDPATWYVRDRAAGRYVHVLAGIEARDVPKLWVVQMSGDSRCRVRAEGLFAEMNVSADQGKVLEDFSERGELVTFAGVPAISFDLPDKRYLLVHSRRRFVQVVIDAEDPARIEELERYFAPTFAARPTKPAPKPEPEPEPEPVPADR